MRIYLDLETASLTDDATVDALRASLKPPGTLKKPESIAAWWQNEAPAALAHAIEKAGLEPETGQIIAISAATDDATVFSRCRTTGEPEGELLKDFFDAVEGTQQAEAAKLPNYSGAWPMDPVFPIGHNLAGFDAPYLWKRSRILKVATPEWLPAPGARPGRDFGDTMIAWAGYGKYIGLARLCQLLGVPSSKEAGIDGSQVAAAWHAGEYQRIAEYCLRDTLATAQVWQRLQGAGV